MKRIAPLVVVCLCLGACEPEETDGIADPLAPGAAGFVETAAGVDPGEFTTLEIRGFPSSDSGDDSTFRNIPTNGRVDAQTYDLDGVDLPLQFRVGGQSIGATGLPYYRVVAWLARGAGTSAPEADGAWGTALVALEDCSFACESTCYCGVALASAAVQLAPSM